MEKSWVFLSYPIHVKAPAYGGRPGFHSQRDKNMDNGDSCNTSKWILSSHMGTHLDFPRHFINNGPSLHDYSADFFIFHHIHVIFINPKPAQIIGSHEIHLNDAPLETEFILIKTGYGAYRGDPEYWCQNPGFSPELASHLRKKLPRLRMIGFDCISLSSFAHRETGKKAHQKFLASPNPILPLEDMDLDPISKTTLPEQIIVAPVQVAGTDGAPCTVLAKMG